MSTREFEFISIGYGKLTGRFSGPGVRISSALLRSRIHAFGFPAATAEKPAQSSEMRRRCASTDSPSAARSATSKIG